MRSELEEIKSRLDIVDVISEYVSLKKAGQNYKGLCPFHAEKTPSFMVSPSKQIYHCFGCGNGGDVFTFITRYENLSFNEAAEALAKKAGVTLKKFQKDTVKTGEKENLLNLHKDALVFYQKSLQQSTEALDYLRKRGVSREAQSLFLIGYAPNRKDALFSYLKGKGYAAEFLKKAGLINYGANSYYDIFRHRVIFPIFGLRGEVIAFGGRVISQHDEPKYLNSPETPIFSKGRILYGLNLAKDSIKKSGYVIIAEGYLDVIALHMYGFPNAVAPLGTALTEGHGKLIKRFVQDVVLVFDGDDAGIRAAKNGISILVENGLNVKVLPLPAGEDPDSFLKKNGKDAFGSLLQKTVSLVDFFITQKGNKPSIAHEVLGIISRIPDNILQGHYIRLLSEGLKINELFIREELKKVKAFRLKGAYARQQEQAPRPFIKSRPSHEVYILQLLLNFPEMTGRIFDSVSAEDFEDSVIKSVFKRIWEAKHGGDLIDYNALITGCDDEGERNLLAGLFFKKIDLDNSDKALVDCLDRFKKERRQKLLNALRDKIKEAESRNDSRLLRSLQLEQQELLRTQKAAGFKGF